MFTPNHVYLSPNKKRLPPQLPMQLCEKSKTFCCFFIAFLESALNLQHFQKKKKIELHSFSVSEIIDSKRRDDLNA